MCEHETKPTAQLLECKTDHITLLTPTLSQGRQRVADLLGVLPSQGGKHPAMGTHNLLLRLGDSMFLEVLAVDPNSQKPPRPRWFGFDALSSEFEPFLGAWVVQTQEIEASVAGASEALGEIESVSRGSLEWKMSIPRDGRRPFDGMAPALIQWSTHTHPSKGMQDHKCRLVELVIHHPEPSRLKFLLTSLAFRDPNVSLSVSLAPTPKLVARIETPLGLRELF